MSERLQSSVVPLQISDDSGVTWKDLICVTNYTNPLSRSKNETETLNCGVLTGSGPVKFDFSGEGVCDVTPGATQVSLDDLRTWLLADTVLQARITNPSTGSVGTKIFLQGEVTVEKADVKASPSDLIKFDFALKGQGNPTNVPA